MSIFLVPTLAAIIISLLIVRAGAIALMLTSMSFDNAKFQALSAFSGTGFNYPRSRAGSQKRTAAQNYLAADDYG